MMAVAMSMCFNALITRTVYARCKVNVYGIMILMNGLHHVAT